MYSVKITDTGRACTRFLSFSNHPTAANCILTLEATEPGSITPEDYFEAGKLSVTPKGEVINERPVVSDFILFYSYKCID